jgi:hypothetical protein
MMKDIYAVGGVSEDDMRKFEETCFVSFPEMAEKEELVPSY